MGTHSNYQHEPTMGREVLEPSSPSLQLGATPSQLPAPDPSPCNDPQNETARCHLCDTGLWNTPQTVRPMSHAQGIRISFAVRSGIPLGRVKQRLDRKEIAQRETIPRQTDSAHNLGELSKILFPNSGHLLQDHHDS